MPKTLGICRDCGERAEFQFGSYCQAHRTSRYGRADGKNYWRNRAIAYVHSAIRQGVLPALNGEHACVDCGGVATDYEHRDYSRPLDVEPVCHGCNKRRGVAIWPTADRFQFKRIGEQS